MVLESQKDHCELSLAGRHVSKATNIGQRGSVLESYRNSNLGFEGRPEDLCAITSASIVLHSASKLSARKHTSKRPGTLTYARNFDCTGKPCKVRSNSIYRETWWTLNLVRYSPLFTRIVASLSGLRPED